MEISTNAVICRYCKKCDTTLSIFNRVSQHFGHYYVCRRCLYREIDRLSIEFINTIPDAKIRDKLLKLKRGLNDNANNEQTN